MGTYCGDTSGSSGTLAGNCSGQAGLKEGADVAVGKIQRQEKKKRFCKHSPWKKETVMHH
jgi:hypothetical protein